MPETTLNGEFVDLIPLKPEHASLTFAWRKSERATNLNRSAQSIELQAAWIASRPYSEYNFIITLKDGLPVGMVSVIGIDPLHRHCEPGRFLIGNEAAVRGVPVAVEAMKLIYHLVFNELKLNRVFGYVTSDNVLMIKWQKFMGMKEEGRWRRHFFINGHFQDAVLFGMLVEEYLDQALPKMNSLIAAGRAKSRPKFEP
jgi:RimJ/RimL family protein N-acetyltransferase